MIPYFCRILNTCVYSLPSEWFDARTPDCLLYKPVSLLQISGFSLANIRFLSCKYPVSLLQISGLSLAKKVCLLKTGMSVAKTVYLQQKETWLSMAKNYLSVAKTVLLYSYVSKKFDLFLYKYLDGKAQTQAFSPPNDIYCLNHILHLAV